VPASLRISILLMTASSVSAVAQSTTDAAATPVPATAIVQRMVEQNAIRAQHLKYFTSQRHYHRIWIDAGDYAVVRVEAQPAENPSFWIKNTDIHHVYAKSGEFWLPQTNTSESKVRLGGTAVLTIDYGTYQFEPRDATAAAPHELTSTAHFEPQ